MPTVTRVLTLCGAFCLLTFAWLASAGVTIEIATPMPAPGWAKLERRILAESSPAVRAFFTKYYDERGYFRHFVRWGANDGPDDAFENTAGWPELHALGASDEILQLHLRAWEGIIRQFTEAKTTDVPIGRQGMYYKDFSVQSDWMHHGEALRTFNVLALSVPLLSRVTRITIDRQTARRLIVAACAGLVLDIVMRTILAPAWQRLLLRVIGW